MYGKNRRDLAHFRCILLERTEKHRELAGIHWEKIRKTSGQNTAPISGAFQWDTMTFSHLSWRIPRDTVAEIFVLGGSETSTARRHPGAGKRKRKRSVIGEII